MFVLQITQSLKRLFGALKYGLMPLTYLRMIYVLLRGGVNITKLNKGDKNLIDLFWEIWTSDVTLTLGRINGRLRAIRTALNVKVVIHSNRRYLCETGRMFTRNGRMLWKFRPWGLSETRIRGEKPLMAALRGWFQEFGFAVNPDYLEQFAHPEELDAHESTVYDGVWSKVHTTYYLYNQRCCPITLTTIPDGSVIIHVQWMSIAELEKQPGWIDLMMALTKCFPAETPGRMRLDHVLGPNN